MIKITLEFSNRVKLYKSSTIKTIHQCPNLRQTVYEIFHPKVPNTFTLERIIYYSMRVLSHTFSFLRPLNFLSRAFVIDQVSASSINSGLSTLSYKLPFISKTRIIAYAYLLTKFTSSF